jgi:hypothetical protein
LGGAAIGVATSRGTTIGSGLLEAGAGRWISALIFSTFMASGWAGAGFAAGGGSGFRICGTGADVTLGDGIFAGVLGAADLMTDFDVGFVAAAFALAARAGLRAMGFATAFFGSDTLVATFLAARLLTAAGFAFGAGLALLFVVGARATRVLAGALCAAFAAGAVRADDAVEAFMPILFLCQRLSQTGQARGTLLPAHGRLVANAMCQRVRVSPRIASATAVNV